MAKVFVNYVNISQESESWCWAAVTANVYNAALSLWPLKTPPPPEKSQAEIANGFPGLGSVSDALQALGMLDSPSRPTTFNEIADELKENNVDTWLNPSGEPVVSEWSFTDGNQGGNHFVAISGLDEVFKHVWIEDPILSPSDSVEYTFCDFEYCYGGAVPQPYGAGGSYASGIAGGFWKVFRTPGGQN